jgi:hypothetical protein
MSTTVRPAATVHKAAAPRAAPHRTARPAPLPAVFARFARRGASTSNAKHPAATVYPDRGTIAVWTGNRDDDPIVPRSSGVDHWSGEPTR